MFSPVASSDNIRLSCRHAVALRYQHASTYQSPCFNPRYLRGSEPFLSISRRQVSPTLAGQAGQHNRAHLEPPSGPFHTQHLVCWSIVQLVFGSQRAKSNTQRAAERTLFQSTLAKSESTREDKSHMPSPKYIGNSKTRILDTRSNPLYITPSGHTWKNFCSVLRLHDTCFVLSKAPCSRNGRDSDSF